jgi:hypothetical protein
MGVNMTGEGVSITGISSYKKRLLLFAFLIEIPVIIMASSP